MIINRNTPYTKEELIELLRAKAQELGRPPIKEDCYFHRSVRKHFGSWNKGLEAARISTYDHHKITDDEIIADIKRVEGELGKQLSFKDYKKLGKYQFGKFRRSWSEFADELGYRKYKNVSKKDLILALKAVVDDLGYVPSTLEFQRHKLGITTTTLYKVYESYDKLITDAGFEIPKRKGGWNKLPDQELFDEIVRISNELGYTPSQLEFTEFSTTTYGNAARRFGSYSNFVKLAGLKPNRRFTTKDGHVVHSRFELMVDNFLFDNNIQHQVQVRVCKNRLWTCDFVIGTAWVECDGMSGNRPENGTAKFQEKLDYYRDNSYDFIVIYPSENWEIRIKCLLRRSL